MTRQHKTKPCALFRAAAGGSSADAAAQTMPGRCAGCVFFSSRNCGRHGDAQVRGDVNFF